MPQPGRAIAKDRAARLRAKGEDALARHLDAMTGSVHAGLVEAPGSARAPNYALIRFDPALPSRHGAILDFRITGHDGAGLKGVPA